MQNARVSFALALLAWAAPALDVTLLSCLSRKVSLGTPVKSRLLHSRTGSALGTRCSACSACVACGPPWDTIFGITARSGDQPLLHLSSQGLRHVCTCNNGPGPTDTDKKVRIRSFILENVATLAQHRGGRTLKLIMRQLQQTGYRVDAKIYNAVEFGLPQKRRRLYIVGLHKDEHIQPELPDPPSVELPLLSSFLDEDYGALGAQPGKRQGTARRNLKQFQQVMEENGIDGDQETWVVDVDASKRFVSAEHEICPTLTYSRASGFWLTSRRRRMNTAEMWRLQGFPVEEITPLASARMMGQLAGNSMCVPILTHIFDYLLPCLFDFN